MWKMGVQNSGLNREKFWDERVDYVKFRGF